MRYLIGCCILILCTSLPITTMGQGEQSVAPVQQGYILVDSVASKKRVKKRRKPSKWEIHPLPNPKKAALFSAVLPGLGQAYNRDYWKIPIVYGAGVGMGIAIDYNHRTYLLLRKNLFALIDEDPDTEVDEIFAGVSATTLRGRTDAFRNTRDQLIIYSGVLYAVNILEAHIAAHLKEFNVNKDLALKIQPSATPLYAGMSVILKIK